MCGSAEYDPRNCKEQCLPLKTFDLASSNASIHSTIDPSDSAASQHQIDIALSLFSSTHTHSMISVLTPLHSSMPVLHRTHRFSTPLPTSMPPIPFDPYLLTLHSLHTSPIPFCASLPMSPHIARKAIPFKIVRVQAVVSSELRRDLY